MRWTREEYIGLMTFEKTDRPMLCELFGPLIGLEEEWKAQGASEAELDMTGFDWDYVPVVRTGGNTGLHRGLEPAILEETAQYQIARDAYGRVTKLIKGMSTIAHPLSYPVTDMDSWQKIKPCFTFDDSRIDREQLAKAKEAQKAGAMVLQSIPGGFDLPRELMGEENVCLCYYDDPELMEDMMQTITDTSLKVLERVVDEIEIDNLIVHEDMAGKTGSLIGPGLIEAYINPHYAKCWEIASANGCRLFSQDSDGNLNAVLDAFMAAGITIAYPMEPAADMDMVALRKKYGNKLGFKGGIDKHVLRDDRAAILRELEYKLQPMMRAGTVFGLDHRIPNGTPLENYRYYAQTAREILGLPPLDGVRMGWERMAF